MWTREDLKSRAKRILMNNYGKALLAAIIMTLVTGGGTAVSTGKSANSSRRSITEAFERLEYNYGPGLVLGVLAIILGIMLVAATISLVLKVFVYGVIEVGCCKTLAIREGENIELGDIVYGFKNGYLRIVGIMFLRQLFTFLWSLLLVIPGIIKAYEYRMVPYILGDNPNMSVEEVFKESKRMMDGNKWEAFVLDLSFILWYLLVAVTAGIAYLYVGPYVELTNAQLYVELRDNNRKYGL